MATGSEIRASKEWQQASPEERQRIFARKVAKDPNYANADAETQALIRQKFGLEEPAVEAAPVAPAPVEAPAEAPAEAPVEGVATEAPAPIFAPVSGDVPEIAAPRAEGPSSTTMAGYGAGTGLIKGLVESYFRSPDKLQRELYARSIRNVLSEAGIDVMAVKDEKGLIDLARQMMPKVLEGQQAQLGSLQSQAEAARAAAGMVPELGDLGGFPTRMSGEKVAGAAAPANWMRAMAGPEHQLPESVIAQATDMTKSSPTGGQALINKDLAAVEKLKGMGAGDYRLAGKGQGQLMLPPEEAAAMGAREAAQAAEQARVAKEALNVLQPQIASVEAEVARLTRLGKDASQFTARLEQLRRMERTARNAVGRGLNVPSQANISPLAKFGYQMAAPSRIPLLGPTTMNALAGAGAFYDIQEAFDRTDPLGAAVHGISGLMNTMSMIPPVNPVTAAVKGIGTIGALGMLPVKMMLPPVPSVMEK
jgi:hypothetical protein